MDKQPSLLPVKAIVLAAPSGSGKSYIMDRLQESGVFQDIQFYEMDYLRCWDKKTDYVQKRLPAAWQEFKQWYDAAEKSVVLDDIYQNIELSSPKKQLMKLKLLSLMAMSSRFVTDLPQALRHQPEDAQFLSLLENYFQGKILLALVVPSYFRYALNIARKRNQRKNIFRAGHLKSKFRERARLNAQIDRFDFILRNPLAGLSEDRLVSLFKEKLQL